MTLSEWSSLSEERQRALIVQWHKEGEWERYYSLASEAAKILEHSLKSIPGVTYVNVGGKMIHFEEPVTCITEADVCVCTNLPEFSKLDGVPGKVSGFKVRQVNLGDKRDDFIKTFTFILKKLRGWNEDDSLKWANERNPEPLTDSLVGGHLGIAVYSEGPVKLAIYALLENQDIWHSIKAAGNDPIDVRNDILSVIRNETKQAGSVDFGHPDRVPNLDWDRAVKSISVLIQRACHRQ